VELVLASIACTLAACTDVDVEKIRFRCDADGECSAGWFCEDIAKVCVRGGRDAGEATCTSGCPDGSVCDPDTNSCRAGCDPVCTGETVCDEVRNRCIFPHGSCILSANAETADGFVATFKDEPHGGGQVPRDFELGGHATCFSDGIRLTKRASQSGGIWFTKTVAQGRFRISATLALRPPDPPDQGDADGFALIWVRDPPGTKGQGAGTLGYGGLNGYAVEIDTFWNFDAPGCTADTEPEPPHLALVRTTTASIEQLCGEQTFAAQSVIGAPLAIEVDLAVVVEPLPNNRAHVVVSLSGETKLDTEIPYIDVPRYVAVTAGTGTLANIHLVTRLELERY
jgi:hypothetical protein